MTSTKNLKQNKKLTAEPAYIRQGSTMILRTAVILLGLIVLAVGFFWLPAGLRSDNIGYYRPILIGLFIPAIPFFFALQQALKLLDYIDKNQAFSQVSVNVLKNIKYCALIVSSLFAAGQPYVFYAAKRDNASGIVLLGFVIIGASFIIATAAALFQRLLQNAVDIKSENDLTV